ncbi:class I SAM-dependent methyltransferase [Nostoc sp. MS1]|uniref:class I SAM-dependent methyltransferase n=1 Tax=Nostoc sp. MS1 TaxID=2764711 RepID=UPI001CC6F2C8|nr:class I SAM-dependent methyltransferase [Nostoc sp. MS1]BCL35197.1 hypothetical protein NSMS1_16440 [Nostoc sp. MS1]
MSNVAKNLEFPRLPLELQQTIERDYANNPYTSGTSVSLSESLVMASLVNHFQLASTLEIGLASGGSAAAIIAAKSYFKCNDLHIAIDPYQKTHSGSTGLRVIEQLGYIDHLEWVEDLSEFYLPKVILSEKKFDFILIDGGHGLGQSMIDAYFSDRLLRIGGFIAIDDIYMISTCNSIKFLINECGYQVINSRLGLPNIPRLIKHSLRLGFNYSSTMSSKCSDALVILQKVKEYYGGY